MPILTRLPSVRTTFTMMRPSMTMFSLTLRERTSIEELGWAILSSRRRGGQGLNGVLNAESAHVGRHTLLAHERVAIEDQRGAKVRRRFAIGPERDDVQHERVVRRLQAEELDVQMADVWRVARRATGGRYDHEAVAGLAGQFQPQIGRTGRGGV